MLDIFARCTESLKGKTFPNGRAWQIDAENLALKLFFHLGSVFMLQDGTTLPKIANVTPNYVDFPSISTLTRVAFETFLCFHFIYIQPVTMEEKEFRHDVWKLGGFLDRQRFMVTTAEGKAKIQEEKLLSVKLKKKIETDPIYIKLPTPRQKDAIKGKWRLGKQWVDIAENSGIHKQFFISLYAYLSSFTHSGHLGILQLAQANERHIQASLANLYTYVNLTLMSHFLISYCDFFKEAQSFMDSHEEYKRIVHTYYVIAEDWEQLINRA
jgi:hypothetical protein